MPYRINWQDTYIVFEYFGKVTSADIRESNQEVYGDSRFDNLKWELVLFDKADSVEFRESDIRLIAYMDKAAARSNPYIKVAFVGTNKVLDQVKKLYSKSENAVPWPVLEFESYDRAIAQITKD